VSKKSNVNKKMTNDSKMLKEIFPGEVRLDARLDLRVKRQAE
jgi:hypothetical protein